MKDKILNALKSKTFFALAINIVIMALIIGVTAFSYDSADDFYNSLYICQYHNYYNNDINYIFATITGSLQYILLNFNCFVLFQILLSCAAFSSVTFVFADKFGKHKAFIFTLVLNILFSFDHYSNILSSKTAALLLTAGFLMALNAIRNKRYSLPFWIGVLEVIFGTFLCFKYFFVGLAFFIAFFIGDMIAKRKYKLPFRKFFWYFRPFVLVFVFIVLVGCGLEYYSYSVNNANAETSGLYRYSVLADKTDDNAFPNYSDYCEELNSVGINSANEYELFVDGYYDENNRLNTAALKKVADIQKRENPYNFFDNAGVTTIAVSVLGCINVHNLLGNILFGDVAEDLALGMQVAALAEGDHLFGHSANFLSAGNGGFNLAVLKQVGHHSAQHSVAAVGGTTEFTGTGHFDSLLINRIRVSRGVSFRLPWSERNQGCPALP